MELRYTPEASKDLDAIHDHITLNSNSPNAADRRIASILKKCSLLKDQPYIGVSLSEKTGRPTDMRFLVCDRYIAFYKIHPSAISIIRIMDSRMDYLDVIFAPSD